MKSIVAHTRLRSIDALRGFVMVLMAVDHVRFFFPLHGAIVDPTKLKESTLPLFLTRWITHICAPTFVLLAGLAVFLSGQNLKDVGALRMNLVRRGIWLVILDITLINFFFSFQVPVVRVVGQVLWAVGWSFILMSVMVKTSPARVFQMGMGVLAVYAVSLAFVNRTPNETLPMVSVLVSAKQIPLGTTHWFSPRYPVLPWLGLMMVGFGFGPLYFQPEADRRRVLGRVGWLLIGTFALHRLLTLPFDTFRAHQATFTAKVFMLLNIDKYPPSIPFLLVTTGITLLLLKKLETAEPTSVERLVMLGRVPMFFYLAHILLAHVLYLGCDFLRRHPPISAIIPPSQSYFTLPFVWALSVIMLVILYPLCVRFQEFKNKSRGAWWVPYF